MKNLKTSLAFFICVLTALTLSGCAKEPPILAPEIDADLTVSEKTDEDNKLSIHLTSDGTDVNITVTAPEALSGVGYRYDTDGLTVDYAGLRCIADEDYLPADSFQQILREISRAIPSATFQEIREDADVFSVRTKSGSTAVTAKDGVIQSIIPSWGNYVFSAG